MFKRGAKIIKYTIDYTILILAFRPFGLNGLEMKIFEIKIIICMMNSHIIIGMLSFS